MRDAGTVDKSAFTHEAGVSFVVVMSYDQIAEARARVWGAVLELTRAWGVEWASAVDEESQKST
jgi:hypothetical protein